MYLKYEPFDQLRYQDTAMVGVRMDFAHKTEVHHFGNIVLHNWKMLKPK